MGNRLSRIYTRTGDDGSTGLGDGSRVPKDDVRVNAYGTVDEANSALGVLLAVPLPDDVRTLLTTVQHQLFDLGGELCIPGHAAIQAADIDALEKQLDHYNADLPVCNVSGHPARTAKAMPPARIAAYAGSRRPATKKSLICR